MKVFISRFVGSYGGGFVLVAAPTREDALIIASKHPNFGFWFKQYDYDLKRTVLKENSILTKFEEVHGLTYDADKPVVIYGDIYKE